jgi:hypothetical protein
MVVNGDASNDKNLTWQPDNDATPLVITDATADPNAAIQFELNPLIAVSETTNVATSQAQAKPR